MSGSSYSAVVYDDDAVVTNNGPDTATAATFTVVASPADLATATSYTVVEGAVTCTLSAATATCTLTAPLTSGSAVQVEVFWTTDLLATGTTTDTFTITTSDTGCYIVLGIATC